MAARAGSALASRRLQIGLHGDERGALFRGLRRMLETDEIVQRTLPLQAEMRPIDGDIQLARPVHVGAVLVMVFRVRGVRRREITGARDYGYKKSASHQRKKYAARRRPEPRISIVHDASPLANTVTH